MPRHHLAARAAAALAASAVLLAPAVPAVADTGSSGDSAAPPPAPGGPSATPAVGIAVDVASDGRGPFTPDDRAGGDSGPANGVVRTLDAITYRVTVNATGGTARDERFVLDAPVGTRWAEVPLACRGAGSRIDGQRLTCHLGDVAEGHAVAVPVVLDVSGDLRNGDRIAVTGTVTADGADTTAPVTSATTRVSAVPRYNLAKNVVGSVLRTDVPGPDGTPGVQLLYPMTVDWQSPVAGQGLLGFERSTGDMSFRDDLSHLLGGRPSGAVLWNGGRPACGRNGEDGVQFGGLPGGRGGGDRSVVDSGTITCTQSAAGGDVDVAVRGAVTDAARIPGRSITGGPVSGGSKAYVVSGWISLWMPTPEAPTSVESVNAFTPLQTSSEGGTPNFPGGTEPTVDNQAKRNIVELGPGTAGKRLWRLGPDGTSVTPGSAKDGDPWATGGTLLRSDVTMTNTGLAPYEDAALCDTFDRQTQRLTAVGGRAPAWSSGFAHARVQYAAYGMASPAQGQAHTCDDTDGPWYDDPDDVPGGIASVGAVRVTGALRGGASAGLYSTVTTERAPDGTRVHDFGHARFGAHRPGWVHDQQDPVLGAGGLADSVLLTEDLARVTKAVVDPGHDAGDTPDRTSSVVPGNTVDFAVRPTLTNGFADGRPTDVTVRDVLPVHTTYVADSASEAPQVDTVTDGDGLRRQRLTWTLHDVGPNSPIQPITYTVQVDEAAPAGSVTNTVTVESPADRSDERWRTADRALRVITTGGVGVEKVTPAPVVVAGDRLVWDLRATNTDDTTIRGVDLIDVLPRTGDERGSTFHGTLGLAVPVPVDPAGQETVRYTDTTPEDVSLDGADPSNRPDGSTRWCAEADLGTTGCPESLRAVTAVRVERATPIPSGETVTHRITLATSGQHDGDTYVNRFGLRASNLALPVQSNPSTVRVVAGAIGDRVWDDRDADGLQDDDEPGAGDVPVTLDGTDDRGDAVERRTRTDERGAYRFDGLRPGDYRVRFTAPEGTGFTEEHVGADPAVDSDAGPDGSTLSVTLARVLGADGSLAGVRRDPTIDAGLVAQDTGTSPDPGTDPGSGPGDGGGGADGDGSNATVGGGSAGGNHEHRPGAATEDRTAGVGGQLAWTGADIAVAVALALTLLVSGVAVLAARRRARRSAD
ncbi:SdrD B-like domain-containing protein [Curtobacterium caseinilyticum]|uniref:SdrD B-like domain-containing protein n=1 Tax=Curtobacterium caseinilyticum TaxID=3055137 RepID=A0ABT7TNQ3_9MICO|nr:SdrD B-like domain-containing protein [Curtobacterium caseinilyticum]MDM7891216.1 SdrD B-like domain-containing protein [Curtobacterium caseinilyticum]